MNVVTLEPALKKLLDELPVGNPDADSAEVWIAFCDRKATVRVGEPADVDFGRWRGPPMAAGAVIIHARNLRTLAETTVSVGAIGWKGPPVVLNGMPVTATKLNVIV